MGMDIGRGGGLRMAQLLGYHHQGNTVGNHQSGVSVPQAVNRDFRHPGSGNELAEPLRHAVGEDGGPGVGGEHPPVLVPPGVPQLGPLFVLPPLILQEHHYRRR